MSDFERDRAELRPPKNTLGLHQLHPQEEDTEASIDVVAVHGLGGDSFSTWSTPERCPTLWLRDLLPASIRYQNARILTFGYDATAFLYPFEKKSNHRTFTFAEQLLGDLKTWRDTPRVANRPIIFVGHSLGGIVIKAALRHASLKPLLYGSILTSTKAIVFFGTPHQGANAAVWAGYLACLGKIVHIRSTEVMKELQTWSPHLDQLASEFCEMATNFRLQTYYETRKINGVKVVEAGSARIGLPHELSASLEADHISICKFNKEDPDWDRVKRRLEVIAREILEPTMPEVPQALPGAQDSESDQGQQFEAFLDDLKPGGRQ